MFQIMYRACEIADFESVAASTGELISQEMEINTDNLHLAVRGAIQAPSTPTPALDLTAYDALLPRNAS
ncbi:hypothetical protein [Arcanobacterium phocae]|uniref:hypothetical protein n=1 Tax=Arcanobacterium phocae TaxID=131112 RepID=UPI001C0ED5A2|nr:hypothetical protein [Arcanobacterium phocae]